MKKRYIFLLTLWITLANSKPSRRQLPHYAFWKPTPLFPLDNLWAKLISSPADVSSYYMSPHSPHIPQRPPDYINPHIPQGPPDYNSFSHSPEYLQPEREDPPSTTNQDVLIDSLNRALMKLNQLLPTEIATTVGTSSGEEYTTNKHQNTVRPEFLAESLNKAIDTLTEVLSKVPEKQPSSVENLIIDPEEIQESVASGITQHMTFSVESAIQKLDDLFKELPEELKRNPNPNHSTQNTDQTLHNIITGSNVQIVHLPSESSGVLPSSNSVSKDTSTSSSIFGVSASTESSLSLFTSKIEEFVSKISEANTVEVEKKETIESITTTTTPTPPIAEVEVFTSASVISTEKSVTDLPGTEGPLSTSPTVTVSSESSNEVPITTPEPIKKSSTDPTIDVRSGFSGRADPDAIVFPDDDDDMVPDRLAPSNIHDIHLPSRFGDTTSSSTTSKPLNLDNQPSAPQPHPVLPAQNPLLVVANNPEDYLGNKLQETTTTRRPQQSNTPISLEYKPHRPFYAPNPIVYPKPIIPPGTEWPAYSTERYTNELADRFQPTTTPPPRTTRKPQGNTPISLEFKPIRPFFAGPVRYPEPIIPSGTPWPASSTERYRPTDLVDRFQQQTTTTQKPKENTPISLEYKPMRPFFAPDPVVYPSPIIPPGTPWPASSTERYPQTSPQNDLGNRFQDKTTTPTPNHNTPIVLGYKPTRSPFLPDPWIYPSPIIPSGTPWPASSTERL